MLLAGQGYDKGNIYHFLVQSRFLVPVVGTYSVSMVAGEDDDGILPQVLLVDGIYNLADFTVHFLHKAIVGVAVHAPVFGSESGGGVDIEIIVSFFLDDIGIVWVLGEVGGKSRTVAYFGYIQVAVRKILAACVFADIMRIVIRSYQEEGLVMFAGKEFHASFGQSVIAVFVNLVESPHFIRNVEFGHMPFAAAGTFVSGVLDQCTQSLCLECFRQCRTISQ